MKILFALILIGFWLASASGFALAQATSTPEFRLDIHYTDTTSTGTGFEFPYLRAIGFDPLASDGYDAQFGEDDDYPGSVEGFHDFYFIYPDTAARHTRVDILHKPATSSFALNYRMDVKFDYAKGHLFWDRNAIPQGINAIWIRPLAQQDTVLADMTRDSVLKIPLIQALNWNYQYLVTLFYNMTQPALGVASAPPVNTSLIQHAAAYPNPIHERGKLALALSEPAMVTVTGFDEAGRECLRQIESVSAGFSSMALANINALHGSILLHIEAASATKTETKNVIVVKD